MNTKLLAQLALESYTNSTHEDERMDAQALVVHLGDETVVAIRGTAGVQDAITDMRYLPWWDGDIEEWCVAGFLKYTHPLIEQIMPELSGNVYFTGHSLGGAAASIFAAHYYMQGLTPAGLVTFGEPRPGFAGLGTIVREIPGYRFVIDGDPVDNVPPWTPFSPFFYKHGREAYELAGRDGFDHPMSGYYDAVPDLSCCNGS